MLSSRSSSRMRLCKDSTNPPRQGWPGGMNAWSVACSLAQRPKAAAMNSGLLSALSAWGAPFRIKLEINGPCLPRSASFDQALQAWRSAGLGGFARAQAAPRPSPASRQSAQACASRTSSWSSILPGHKQPGLLRTTLSKQTVQKTQTPPRALRFGIE